MIKFQIAIIELFVKVSEILKKKKKTTHSYRQKSYYLPHLHELNMAFILY